MLRRLSPYLLLAVLALIFFGELVLHPAQILYSPHSDFLALHLPSKWFLVRSFQETGELIGEARRKRVIGRPSKA